MRVIQRRTRAKKIIKENENGWEACKPYCTEDATFGCACLPQTRLDDYAGWMKGLKEGPLPNCRYEIKSETTSEKDVTFVAIFHGTHTGPGPVPVSDPPKSTQCPYTYTFTFNEEGKCTALYKVFDIFTAFSQLGWPLPNAS